MIDFGGDGDGSGKDPIGGELRGRYFEKVEVELDYVEILATIAELCFSQSKGRFTQNSGKVGFVVLQKLMRIFIVHLGDDLPPIVRAEWDKVLGER